MQNERTLVEERIHNLKKFYEKTDYLLDKLPDAVPNNVKTRLKDAILGDKDLKALMNGLESHRPPRLFMIGRTGVGKSSLINALCGSYTATVSDTRSCTSDVQFYKYTDGDRTLMEICDTRGIAESTSINNDISAEDMLRKQVIEFSPDVAILVLSCTHRDDIDKDVEFLKGLSKTYQEINQLQLPIVVVVNKCDEMAPSRFKDPADYPQSKLDNIQDVVSNYKGIIVRSGLKINDIIAVSSLIDWQTPDGLEISAENIANLPQKDIENLQIAFDGRYQIEELLNILTDSIQDYEAQIGFRLAARLTEVVHRLAKYLNNTFSGIAATVALTPIPVSDIYILLILQTVLVALIASLSGRDISLETAKEFILGIGGVAGLGYTLKFIVQQGAKFLNTVWPLIGSAVSSAVAASGTSAIGNAAIAYYINDATMDDAKKIFTKLRGE